MPLDPEAEAIAAELLVLYERAGERIDAELAAIAGDLRQVRRRRRLIELAAAIEVMKDELDGAARGWITRRLPETYRLGGTALADELGLSFEWSQVHRAAVQQLATETFDVLLAATRFMTADAKALVREVSRAGTASALLEGRTATQAARDVARVIEDHGIRAVRYSNGARHGIADYADTVLRTTTARAYNAGTLNTGTLAGIQFYECFDGAACGMSSHQDGDKANGTIRSAAEAMAHPLAHPRCARSWSPRPDVRSAQGARDLQPLSDELRAAQAVEEDARAAQRTVSGRLTVQERRRRRTASRRTRRVRS